MSASSSAGHAPPGPSRGSTREGTERNDLSGRAEPHSVCAPGAAGQEPRQESSWGGLRVCPAASPAVQGDVGLRGSLLPLAGEGPHCGSRATTFTTMGTLRGPPGPWSQAGPPVTGGRGCSSQAAHCGDARGGSQAGLRPQALGNWLAQPGRGAESQDCPFCVCPDHGLATAACSHGHVVQAVHCGPVLRPTCPTPLLGDKPAPLRVLPSSWPQPSGRFSFQVRSPLRPAEGRRRRLWCACIAVLLPLIAPTQPMWRLELR